MSYTCKSLSADRAEIRIDGEIGGGWFTEDPVTAKQFAKDLKALGKPKALDIYINSPGGSIFDGSAIYNQLKRHTATKTVYVEGLAASIASMIAMAGDEVVIPENAFLMIHRANGFVQGDAGDMRQMADVLEKLESGIVTAYVAKTGRDAAEINEWMADETWLTGPEAVALGFADRTTDAIPATACLTPTALTHFKAPPAPIAALAPLVSDSDSATQDVPMTDVTDTESPPPAAESAALPDPVAASEGAIESPAPVSIPVDSAAIAAHCARIAADCASAGFPQLAAGLIAQQAEPAVVADRLSMAAQIKAACALAKLPERLDHYLNSGMTETEARADLFTLLAARDQETPLNAVPPVFTNPLAEAMAAWRAANPKAVSTDAVVMATVLRDNPKLYDAYLASQKGA